jgi:hypothetical protein
MRRFPPLPRGVAITVSALGTILVITQSFSSAPVSAQSGEESTRSWPPDLTHYARPLGPFESGDLRGAGLPPPIFLRDTVVSNTNPALTTTDTANDGETSIAINPQNPNDIVISAFSGSWGANTNVYHSLDGGLTWTSRNTIPNPPTNLGNGCPCDQAFDYSRGSNLAGTFLLNQGDIVSGLTTNITSAANWLWRTLGVPPTTQLTNANTASSLLTSDQPWLLVNMDPTTTTEDNVYVAYDDFSGGPNMQVAVSDDIDAAPAAALNFVTDVQVGQSTAGTNPGLRLAEDPRTGFMYALWQRCTANCGSDNPKTIDYMLNRSQDGGATWPLGGGTGIVVATGVSTQPRPKFGTVNALLGGVLHAGVDPTTGDVYYAYGNRDGGTGNDRIAVRRITFDGSGTPIVGGEVFINGQVESAIPSVAVANDGTVGVFYYTFDGFSSDAFPIFSAHVTFSRDQGSTWTNTKMQTFLSSAQDSGNNRQRVLGDYMQMKTVGRTFYGAYTGNGATFGRAVSNHDPIFFKASVGPKLDTRVTSDFGDVCRGDSKTTQLQIFNTGIDDLIVYSVARVSGSTDITVGSGPLLPAVVAPGSHIDFDITCAPSSVGPRSAVIRITSNDPDRPSIDITHTCDAPEPDVRVSGSGAFGQVCGGAAPAEQRIDVCNVGACNLSVISATSNCADFTVVDTPFPAPVSKDFCMPITVRFTPTSTGPKSCTLTITTDDPQTPIITRPLTGDTPASSIDVPFPSGQAFSPGVVQSIGACKVPQPFPISNTGGCPLRITNVEIGGTNAGDFSISGLPSFPIILDPGHIAGEGDLKTVFAATALDRDRLATLTVTYISDAVTGATTQVTRPLCGEGVNTGARILVTNGAGVPYALVKQIQVHRLVGQKQKVLVDTASVSKNLPLVTVNPTLPCPQVRYHKELGTVSNPIMLAPGAYTATATVNVGGKNVKKTVAFDVSTCTFNPNIRIVIP